MLCLPGSTTKAGPPTTRVPSSVSSRAHSSSSIGSIRACTNTEALCRAASLTACLKLGPPGRRSALTPRDEPLSSGLMKRELPTFRRALLHAWAQRVSSISNPGFISGPSIQGGGFEVNPSNHRRACLSNKSEGTVGMPSKAKSFAAFCLCIPRALERVSHPHRGRFASMHRPCRFPSSPPKPWVTAKAASRGNCSEPQKIPCPGTMVRGWSV